VIDYRPEGLGSIDSVVVVDLRGVDADRVHEHIAESDALRSANVSGVAAQEIAELWRALPPGEAMRCHTPPYGLRFRLGTSPVLDASVCWECNNAFGFVGGESIYFAFDAGATASRALLDRLKTLLPVVATVSDDETLELGGRGKAR
jgi:hypothetical protein